MAQLTLRPALIGIILLARLAPAGAQNFTDLDLQTLMDMEVNVTSVAKKPMRLADSPAAVTVITQEDIRRLGISRLPELLRIVPGLDVSRISANTWAISARGFNRQYANKLLVLIDGRSVFTPSFAGVFWDVQDLMIEDIERIEVIRGPGATLWGANAVNGVINITTKAALDTQGGLLASEAGTQTQPAISARYGGALSQDTHYRAYVKYVNDEPFRRQDGQDAPDASHSLRAGFRGDWNRTPEDLFTLQGEGYRAREGESVRQPLLTPPFGQMLDRRDTQDGANLIGRWTRTRAGGSYTSLQAYVDHFHQGVGEAVEDRDTVDVQWEHRLAPGVRHDLIWGLGYRFTADEFTQTPLATWSPTSRHLNLYTTFVQDEIVVVPRRLAVTIGSKLEHNDFTGFELQPSVRLSWTLQERHTVWASIAHAISTPSRLERDARVTRSVSQPSPQSPVVEVALLGEPALQSERLNAYELGYRLEASPDLSFDLAVFFNQYGGVTRPVPGDTELVLAPIPHVVATQKWANTVHGNTHGGEASLQWQPLDRWRVTAAYSYLTMDVYDLLDGASPSQQASVRSYINLPHHVEINTAVYYVDRIDALIGLESTPIPAYVRLDTGLTWRPRAGLEWGLWGQNLLQSRHPENTSFSTNLITEVPRAFLARATWQF
jgi:iron complex outermembrane receptor protein